MKGMNQYEGISIRPNAPHSSLSQSEGFLGREALPAITLLQAPQGDPILSFQNEFSVQE